MEEDKVALKSQPVPKLNWSLESDPVNAKSASLESIGDSAMPPGRLENKNTEEIQAVSELEIKQEDNEANTAHGIENEIRATSVDHNEIREYNGSSCENYNFQQGIDSVHANNGTSIEIRDDNVPNEYFVISEIDLGEEANYCFDPTRRKRIKKSTALNYIDQLQQYALQNDLTEVYYKLSEIGLLIKLTCPKSFTERRTVINENKNQRKHEVPFNESYRDKTDSYSHLAQSTNSSVLTTVTPVVYASNSGPEFVGDNQNNISNADFNRENTSLIRKKTNAERMREYRERKKQRRLQEFLLNGNTDIVKLKKTPAERMREYRARKKLLAQQAAEEVSNSKTDLTSGLCGDSNSINSSVVNEPVAKEYDLSESDGSVTLCKNEHISQDFPHIDDPIAVNESAYLCEASLSDNGEKICEIENTSHDSLCAGLETLDGITVQDSKSQNVESGQEDDVIVLSEDDQNNCELLTPLIDQGLRREKRPEGKSTEHVCRVNEKKQIKNFRSSPANEMSNDEKRRQRCAERVRRWRERKKLEKLAAMGNL